VTQPTEGVARELDGSPQETVAYAKGESDRNRNRGVSVKDRLSRPVRRGASGRHRFPVSNATAGQILDEAKMMTRIDIGTRLKPARGEKKDGWRGEEAKKKEQKGSSFATKGGYCKKDAKKAAGGKKIFFLGRWGEEKS